MLVSDKDQKHLEKYHLSIYLVVKVCKLVNAKFLKGFQHLCSDAIITWCFSKLGILDSSFHLTLNYGRASIIAWFRQLWTGISKQFAYILGPTRVNSQKKKRWIYRHEGTS